MNGHPDWPRVFQKSIIQHEYDDELPRDTNALAVAGSAELPQERMESTCPLCYERVSANLETETDNAPCNVQLRHTLNEHIQKHLLRLAFNSFHDVSLLDHNPSSDERPDGSCDDLSLGNEAVLASETGANLHRAGRYKEAAKRYEHAWQLSKDRLGPRNPSTLSFLANIAVCICKDEDVPSEELFERAKEVTTSGNLASEYQEQEEHDKADAIWAKLRDEGMEECDIYPYTLKFLWTAANSYENLGDYRRAENLHRMVLRLRSSVLGAQHPDTLCSRGRIAHILTQQGKHSVAEGEYKDLLRLRIQVLGYVHPHVDITRDNLCYVLHAQGKNDQTVEKEVQEFEREICSKTINAV